MRGFLPAPALAIVSRMSRKCFWLILYLLCAASAYAQVSPITSGYGANGSFTASETRFSSPLFRDKDVVVYLPTLGANTNSPAPVIFFAPGFSVQEPDTYAPLIQHCPQYRRHFTKNADWTFQSGPLKEGPNRRGKSCLIRDRKSVV